MLLERLRLKFSHFSTSKDGPTMISVAMLFAKVGILFDLAMYMDNIVFIPVE